MGGADIQLLGGANSDTETEKENEPAKQWLSWVAIDLNQVAAPIDGSMYGMVLSAQYACSKLVWQ